MSLRMQCNYCNRYYFATLANTQVWGLYIKTTCPFCNSMYEDKLLNFTETQVKEENKPGNRLKYAVSMIRTAKPLEKELSEGAYVKKKN